MHRAALALAVTLAAALPPSSLSSSQNCPAGHPVTEMGRRFTVEEVFPSSAVRHTISHTSAGDATRYLRVRLRVTPLGSEPWLLAVRDGGFRLLQTFSAAEFTSAREVWTMRVPGRQVWFDLETEASSRPVELRFLEYVAMPEEAQNPYYSLQTSGVENFQGLYTNGVATASRRLGDMVGFLMTSWGQQSWCCSGVVLAPDLMLTNWHCGGTAPLPPSAYWNRDVCRRTVIDMSWDDDAFSHEFGCVEVLVQDEARDYALLRIQPIERKGELRPAVISSSPVAQNDFVQIVHHPGCRKKHISHTCSVASVDYRSWRDAQSRTDFSHTCDTEGGSSGAPVFDDGGTLVGLHHLGFDIDAQTCTATDRVNKAVSIRSIVDDLRARRPDLTSRLKFEATHP